MYDNPFCHSILSLFNGTMCLPQITAGEYGGLPAVQKKTAVTDFRMLKSLSIAYTGTTEDITAKKIYALSRFTQDAAKLNRTGLRSRLT